MSVPPTINLLTPGRLITAPPTLIGPGQFSRLQARSSKGGSSSPVISDSSAERSARGQIRNLFTRFYAFHSTRLLLKLLLYSLLFAILTYPATMHSSMIQTKLEMHKKRLFRSFLNNLLSNVRRYFLVLGQFHSTSGSTLAHRT